MGKISCQVPELRIGFETFSRKYPQGLSIQFGYARGEPLIYLICSSEQSSAAEMADDGKLIAVIGDEVSES